jgi:hypothetical protein
MEWVSDSEERKKIVAGMRRKPWTGFLDRNKVDVLANKYGFPASFDLTDRLSEALWRYTKRSTNPLGAPFTSDELKAEAPLSMITAVHFSLWQSNNKSIFSARQKREKAFPDQGNFSVRRKRGGALAAAAKAHRAEPRERGRPLELWTVALLRTLGAIYEDGTQKKPSISRSAGKPYRGQGYNFARDVYQIANIPLPLHHIREMEYRRRIRRKWKARFTARNKPTY